MLLICKQCKHMIATEMVSGGLSLKTCPERCGANELSVPRRFVHGIDCIDRCGTRRIVSNEEYAKEILDFMPDA